jgi:SAM-dependent methyltransferase
MHQDDLSDSRAAATFDRYQHTYRDAVNSSIGFSRGNVDVLARLKADDIVRTLNRAGQGAARSRVLDVGCGVGVTDAHLVKRVGELHGADVSPGVLDSAAAGNPSVSYRSFDGKQLPYEDGSFDAAFAICVFHHVAPGERSALMAEMNRVTRPGGLVSVYEHNPTNPLTRLAVSRCEFDEDVDLLRPGEVRRLLRETGTGPIESRYITFFPWDVPILHGVERRLSRLPLGGQYVVVGRTAASGRS